MFSNAGKSRIGQYTIKVFIEDDYMNAIVTSLTAVTVLSRDKTAYSPQLKHVHADKGM